jgi:hypothetical protein
MTCDEEAKNLFGKPGIEETMNEEEFLPGSSFPVLLIKK